MSIILTHSIKIIWKIVEKCPCCQVQLHPVIWKTAIWWIPINSGWAKCQSITNRFSQFVLERYSRRELLVLKVLEIRFWWLAQVEAKYDHSLTFLCEYVYIWSNYKIFFNQEFCLDVGFQFLVFGFDISENLFLLFFVQFLFFFDLLVSTSQFLKLILLFISQIIKLILSEFLLDFHLSFNFLFDMGISFNSQLMNNLLNSLDNFLLFILFFNNKFS